MSCQTTFKRMSSSKRSLLDLLPQPKQRHSKASVAKKRKKETEGENGEKDAPREAAEKLQDNEQYRVNCQSVQQTPVAVAVPVPVGEEVSTDDVESMPEDNVQDRGAAIMAAIHEEQSRTKKGRKGADDIEVKEISQDSLKQGVSAVQREVDAIGLALKADDGEEEKVVMPDYTLSKEAHRKHQITTLYQTMKKNETKLMTKDAQNAKTKRETERKYGWR